MQALHAQLGFTTQRWIIDPPQSIILPREETPVSHLQLCLVSTVYASYQILRVRVHAQFGHTT